ncbi:hypothetical protein [Deminuibacter soli]|uniref:hypothetical protein n=1 Tax=Deminuibacter soli TaxID=2291815 RepID=UPI00131485A0|nr:hypothetical protein [Deminuibacter soli]
MLPRLLLILCALLPLYGQSQQNDAAFTDSVVQQYNASFVRWYSNVIQQPIIPGCGNGNTGIVH